MSRTELYVVQPNGDLARDQELSNSWGGAVRIWDAIYERHFHPKPVRYGRVVDSPMMLDRDKETQRFWNLAHDEAIPRFARRVYAWTFDRIVVPRDECAGLANDCDLFDRAYPSPPEHVNHLPALAAYLRTMATRDVRGVAVNWTSVSDAWPEVRLNPDDDESDDYRSPNLDTDAGWRFLSAVVATLTPEAP